MKICLSHEAIQQLQNRLDTAEARIVQLEQHLPVNGGPRSRDNTMTEQEQIHALATRLTALEQHVIHQSAAIQQTLQSVQDIEM